MSIEQDTNVIVEFSWVCDENPDVRYKVKTHIVNGIQTVSLSEDGESWFNLPASFFFELVQTLTQYRQYHQSRVPATRAPQFRSGSMPTGNVMPANGGFVMQDPLPQAAQVSQFGLPLPTPTRKMDSQGTLEPMAVVDMNPLQNFSNIEMLVSRNPHSQQPVGGGVRRQRQSAASEEIVNRPVIRGADEQTARMLRGGGNSEKSIKSRHGQ
jgi:hypothetical protein